MNLTDIAHPIPLALLGREAGLVQDLQTLLGLHGYLDPPADGKFGPVSHWALSEFAKAKALPVEAGLTPQLAAALLNLDRPALPPIVQTGTWFDRIIAAMVAREYWICRHPEAVNIVYVEGLTPEGMANDNRPNAFNDLRIIFTVNAAGVPVHRVWEGTTEPGRHWTLDPMSPKGAARIAFAQFKAWVVGTHHPGKASAHEALVQAEPILVHRDLNKDFQRQGDETEFGLFQINQHWGYDAPPDNLGNTSAGCLVGRTRSGHRQFMKAVKSDPRFAVSGGYRFMTALLPAHDL